MTGKKLLYGLNPVLEAIRAGRTSGAVYIHEGRAGRLEALLKEAAAKGIAVKRVPMAFFDSRFPKGHQGVAAEAAASRTPYTPFERLLEIPVEKGEAPFFVILDLVEDPRNLGAILRTAEAAGVHGVVIQERRAAGLGPAAMKASAGAAGYAAVASVVNIKHAIEEMKDRGITIAGAEAGAGVDVWEADLGGPMALVVGSEGGGLRKTVRERCDLMVRLPMKGRLNSLNASVAAGIIIYEILRQRMSKS